jgi:spore maturation protein CgeB
MSKNLRFRIFAHSWTSDWNHGNAHFLRGLAYELMRMGHDVRCYEEIDSWSMSNLLQEGFSIARNSVDQFWRSFPGFDVRFFSPHSDFPRFAADELRDADVVLIHEWNRPEVVNAILSLKRKLGFVALFHDTHHRAYTSPQDIAHIKLNEFDGVLAFGEALRQVYLEAFRVRRAWTFHEAADTARFAPIDSQKSLDLVWIGNWGDEERTRELQEFLLGPASLLKDGKIAVHGVRYPAQARSRLKEVGVEYRGYLPNLETPQIYANTAVTLHVPRRFYTNGLSGIPTIRVFEALACGVPLLCSPWNDTEGLFRAGQDYICVPDGMSMAAEIRHLLTDTRARQQLAANGLATIRARHTCAHRAQQLTDICQELGK